MTSLGEVQRIIGLSLNKIQMGRNQRGGLPLHKNLLVATVLNKARDVYMQETMYMNYRLMACGQFTPEPEEMEDEDTPEVEDYEEDSESDVEDEVDAATATKKEYITQALSSCAAQSLPGAIPTIPTTTSSNTSCDLQQPPSPSLFLSALSAASCANAAAQQHQQQLEAKQSLTPASVTVTNTLPSSTTPSSSQMYNSSDEGFIDESDCDCDRRNFCQDSTENRVPFQYCYTCAPFHPSNGRGPTLVSPQSTPAGCVLPPSSSLHQQSQGQDQEDKLIYDMDSKSTTKNQSLSSPTTLLTKRKRHISVEETEDAISSILPKKLKGGDGGEKEADLNDSGYQDQDQDQEENQYFHPAFRGHNPNGMEVEQITSLVSIFSFGQQLFNSGCMDRQPKVYTPSPETSSTSTTSNSSSESKSSSSPTSKGGDEDESDDSDSDTSSDSGHSSDDQNNTYEKPLEDITTSLKKGDLQQRCASQICESESGSTTTAVAVATVV